MPEEDTTTYTTTTDNSNINTAEPVRKVVGYVKLKPGYRVTHNLFLLFVLFTLISGGFALFTHLTPVQQNPQNKLDQYDFYDILGFYLFCVWNSIMWALIILIPSLTTVNREKCLPLFYLSGCSVFLIRLSDFFIPATPFQVISSVTFNFFSYLIYMAIFVVLYGLPDDMYVSSTMSSMKPWRPVYEGEEIPRSTSARNTGNNVNSTV